MNLLDRDGDASGSRADGTRIRLPSLPGPLAAAAVGLLCAALAMLLVWLGERGCDAVRGTPSCGGGVGLLLLAAVATVTLVAGFRLLRLLHVPDPGLSSLLGFALFVIVLMTTLLDHIFSASMWVVLPALAALTYALAAWVAAQIVSRG